MREFVTALQATPIPYTLMLDGLSMVLLTIASQLPPKGDEPPLLVRRDWPGVVGIVIFLVGLVLYSVPVSMAVP
jgi:hypothetical protein